MLVTTRNHGGQPDEPPSHRFEHSRRHFRQPPRTVSAAIVQRLVAADPGTNITYRDLAAAPLSHLSGAYLAGQRADVQHDQALQDELDLGGAALAEFLAADIVVIGAPMYNFAIPSQLKAWIDRICVAGKTFRYTEQGAVGLAGGKRCGGFYGPDTPTAAADHQESYLRTVFHFLGVKDVEVIRAEGLAMGPEQRGKALESAKSEAAHLRTAA